MVRALVLPPHSTRLILVIIVYWSFPGGASGKEPTCHCRRCRDAGLISVWGGSPEEGMTTHSSLLGLRVPRTEEPGGLQSTGSQRARHDLAPMHTLILLLITLKKNSNQNNSTKNKIMYLTQPNHLPMRKLTS